VLVIAGLTDTFFIYPKPPIHGRILALVVETIFVGNRGEATTMDDKRVAVLLEQLVSEFRTFGEGLQIVQNEQKEQRQILNGLTEDMDIVKPSLKSLIADMDVVKPSLKSLIADMDVVKPSLAKINNRLDAIEGEIIKLNPDSQAVFLKQVK
jgi:hypothetical protein